MRDRSGYIYIIYNKNTGYYKIGRSANPKVRINGLQSRTTDSLETIGLYSCEDMCSAEYSIHNRYRHKKLDRDLLIRYRRQRLSSEWFCLDSNDIEEIERHIVGGCYKKDNLPKDIFESSALENMSQSISSGILNTRKAKGLTQMELHKISGVAQKDISAYERGKTSNIMADTLARLASALDVSLDYLVWGEQKNEKV